MFSVLSLCRAAGISISLRELKIYLISSDFIYKIFSMKRSLRRVNYCTTNGRHFTIIGIFLKLTGSTYQVLLKIFPI